MSDEAGSQDLPDPLEQAVSRATMSEFATSIVNRLFLVGLIRDIRATVFSPGADPLGGAEKAHGPHSARIAGTGTGDRRAAGATG